MKRDLSNASCFYLIIMKSESRSWIFLVPTQGLYWFLQYFCYPMQDSSITDMSIKGFVHDHFCVVLLRISFITLPCPRLLKGSIIIYFLFTFCKWPIICHESWDGSWCGLLLFLRLVRTQHYYKLCHGPCQTAQSCVVSGITRRILSDCQQPVKLQVAQQHLLLGNASLGLVTVKQAGNQFIHWIATKEYYHEESSEGNEWTMEVHGRILSLQPHQQQTK